jgi:serine/threonine protein kinase
MEIDTLDYKSVRDMKDESIKDFIHETKVMTQVKDAGAKNINLLIEAISIHSQLWLVCEYCPGGSVKTLVSIVLCHAPFIPFIFIFPLPVFFFPSLVER